MDFPLLSPRAFRCKRRAVFASTLAVLALTGVVGLGLPHQRVEAQLKTDSVQTPFGRAPLSFADIVDRVKPAVVSIHVTNGGAKVAQKGGPPRGKDLLPDLPDDHPVERVLQAAAAGVPRPAGPQSRAAEPGTRLGLRDLA